MFFAPTFFMYIYNIYLYSARSLTRQAARHVPVFECHLISFFFLLFFFLYLSFFIFLPPAPLRSMVTWKPEGMAIVTWGDHCVSDLIPPLLMSALGFLLARLAIGNPDWLLDVHLSSDDSN